MIFRRIVIVSFFSLSLFSCKQLEDFEPYENKNLQAPRIYNMDAIGLRNGSAMGQCILHIDLIKLYESNTNRDFDELRRNNHRVDIIIDGDFKSGFSIQDNYIMNCEHSFPSGYEGLHELIIKITPAYDGYDPQPSDLSSYLGFNSKDLIFKQNVMFTKEEMGDLSLKKANKIDGVAYIEWDITDGSNPSVYRFRYQNSSGETSDTVIFGNISRFEYNDFGSDILYIEYSNRIGNLKSRDIRIF